MTKTKVCLEGFQLFHKIKMFFFFFKKNKGPKYDVSTMVCCPLCGEDVHVGTAGPQGLNQHQGKKKCLANIEKKRQDEKKGKNLTLFSLMRRQDRREPTEAEIVREAERKEATSSSRIVVGPPAATPLPDPYRDGPMLEGSQDLNRRVIGEEGESSVDRIPGRRKGCRDAWLLLDQLHAVIRTIPCNVSEGKQGDELASYNRSAALTACAEISVDELWENINPGLDRMLGFGRPNDEIKAIVRRGALGVDGLFEYLEVVVEEGGVVGGLIEGKVSALINAINE